MKKNFLKRLMVSFLAASMMLITVPVSAAEFEMGDNGLPEAEIVSMVSEEDELLLEVEMNTLKVADDCVPISISTGMDENECWRLTPGYSIEQHSDPEIVLNVKCEHGLYQVKITDDMCSHYSTDQVNQIFTIIVTYRGLMVPMKIMYQYPIDNYRDMKKDDWFYEAANNVYKKLLMLGLTSTSWGPYSSLSRAQFATILYRMMDEPEYTTTKSFPDVAADIWYEDPVLWAAEKGIVTGYQNGNFGPADMITRDQMAVMMYRFANVCGYDTSKKVALDGFVDGSHVPSYATEAMSWAVANGIITGKDNGKRLAPLENTARAECAAIVSRFETWAIYG